MITVNLGQSRHYRFLKNGDLKYQKSKPADGIWRLIVANEESGLMHIRFYDSQPQPSNVASTLQRICENENPTNVHDLLIPRKVEALCPGLQEHFSKKGYKIYIPHHGFAAGVRTMGNADDLLNWIEIETRDLREAMASVNEITRACHNPDGYFTIQLHDKHDFGPDSPIVVAANIARRVTLDRGRDPEKGKLLRDKETPTAPLNRGKMVPPQEDVLLTLLHKARTGWFDHSESQAIEILYEIRENGPDPRLTLELGNIMLTEQLNSVAQRDSWYRFITSFKSHLHFDTTLLRQAQEAFREALKHPFKTRFGTVSLLAAVVEINYAPSSGDMSLRSIPNHNRLEDMIKNRGSQNIISPWLNNIDDEIPDFLRGGGPFMWGDFCSRTPMSPRMCLEQVKNPGARRRLGVIVSAARPPIGQEILNNASLAGQIAEFLNNRLATVNHDITCTISPIKHYGEIMRIKEQHSLIHSTPSPELTDRQDFYTPPSE